jgi:hypothetical protein
MKDFEEVIGRIQTSIPNFTANYRCFDCLNKGGLPTEEDIQTKKKERVKKRSVDIFTSLCRVILHLEKNARESLYSSPIFYFGRVFPFSLLMGPLKQRILTEGEGLVQYTSLY